MQTGLSDESSANKVPDFTVILENWMGLTTRRRAELETELTLFFTVNV